jgi:hypothetical protein
MDGRSGSTEEQPTDGRGTARVLLVIGLTLALGSAAVLVFSSDARLLRVGVVAALWAALIGGFAAAKYRRAAVDRADKSAELESLYQFELEREVAARREYELEVEAEIRREVEEDSRHELDALRAELRILRENLEGLLGGEVFVERVALRAESTRVRSLSATTTRSSTSRTGCAACPSDRARASRAGCPTTP